VAIAGTVANAPLSDTCEPGVGGFAEGDLARRPHRPPADRVLGVGPPRLRLGEGGERLLDPPPVSGAPDACLVGRPAVAASTRAARARLHMTDDDRDVAGHDPTVTVPWDSRGTVYCPARRFSADVTGSQRNRADACGLAQSSRKYPTI